MFANSDELLKYVKDEDVEMIDVRFCDLPGIMQHFTVPVSSFGQAVFDKGGYFPVAPYDHFGELRDEMVIELERSGLTVERAHHEVGTAGQAEINYNFAELLKAADDVMKFKYVVKNVAWRNNKSATFMP